MVIGLVNIMPPAAIERTERQFRTMLDRAAPWQKIRLRLFRPHSLVGAASGLANIHQPYETMDALWESRLDGLIVTGTQPSSSSITDEECWPVLKKLLVWAGDNTISAIWSCFAAHAAVYGLSGVQRQPLAEKLSGIFLAKRTEKHGILGSAPASWRVPPRYFRQAAGGQRFSVLPRSPGIRTGHAGCGIPERHQAVRLRRPGGISKLSRRLFYRGKYRRVYRFAGACRRHA
jgi:homoserine O-succinyltransferase